MHSEGQSRDRHHREEYDGHLTGLLSHSMHQADVSTFDRSVDSIEALIKFVDLSVLRYRFDIECALRWIQRKRVERADDRGRRYDECELSKHLSRDTGQKRGGQKD